jgi:hypothetical protein
MDTSALASAFIGAQGSQVQMVMAAKMLKMNAEAGAAVANMIDAAQQNLQALTAAGTGQSVDISV